MDRKSALLYINTVATIVIAAILFLFPVLFLTTTTDFFTLPKQVLVVAGSITLLFLWGIKNLVAGKLTLALNPLNLPVLLFGIFVMLSAIVSPNKYDALPQAVPVLMLVIFFFAIINFITDKHSLTIALASLLIGTAASGVLTLLAQLGINMLSLQENQLAGFNTMGSPIQYIVFLTPLLVFAITAVALELRSKGVAKFSKKFSNILEFVALFGIALGIGVVSYQIFTSAEKPILLPFGYGFQIALSTLSLNADRLIQSFLMGSGYGTFTVDFSQYVTSTFNNYPFWNLSFSFSSSYILELLATTGILGFLSFIFIAFKFIKTKTSVLNPLFLSICILFVLSLLLPFSFSIVFLLTTLLALYASQLTIAGRKKFNLATVSLVTLFQDLFSAHEGDNKETKENYVLPVLFLLFSIIFSAYILFWMVAQGELDRKGYYNYVISDLAFAKSFTPNALRNGNETYDLQVQALTEYPYRSDYHRIFSQINLTLASNLVNAQQGREPSTETQQNILNLLQQSINSGRLAVTLSENSSSNWQNLGQIYRNLIGVGENAEQFTIDSYSKAIQLYPSSPILALELGGVYYQLNQLDLAQNQFLRAVSLKPDYANAYYNLAKVMEQKGELEEALQQLQIVQQLVQNDKTNLEQVNADITSLQDKIKNGATEPSEDQANNSSLNAGEPQTQFPEQNPKVNLPPPPSASQSAE